MNERVTKGDFQVRMLLAILLVYAFAPAYQAAEEPRPPCPVIYSTDLYYTIEDIDDYFGAAVLLKSPEVDIKGIILDNHNYPSDGEKAIAKLMEYGGRKVPVTKGLGLFQMRSFADKAYYVDDQGGVDHPMLYLRRETKHLENPNQVVSPQDRFQVSDVDPKARLGILLMA